MRGLVMSLNQFLHALADLIEDWELNDHDEGYMQEVTSLYKRYQKDGANKDEFKIGI
jgi:hypothetical protein